MNTENEMNQAKLFVKGSLTGKALANFKKRLSKDNELQKLVTSYQSELIKEVGILYPKQKKFTDILDKVHTERLQKVRVNKKPKKNNYYTYEEIINPFTPDKELDKGVKKSEPAYELELALRRSQIGLPPLKKLKLTTPKNEIDAEYELEFAFDKKHKFKLLLTIYDNEGNRMPIGEENIDKKVSLEDKGRDIIIAKKTNNFSLLLEDFKPGIYYWRLKPKNDNRAENYKDITRSFYIRKDLMPKPPPNDLS